MLQHIAHMRKMSNNNFSKSLKVSYDKDCVFNQFVDQN